LTLKVAKRGEGIMVFWPDFKGLRLGCFLLQAKGCQRCVNGFGINPAIDKPTSSL
jgi:hypothetical protein